MDMYVSTSSSFLLLSKKTYAVCCNKVRRASASTVAATTSDAGLIEAAKIDDAAMLVAVSIIFVFVH